MTRRFSSKAPAFQTQGVAARHRVDNFVIDRQAGAFVAFLALLG